MGSQKRIGNFASGFTQDEETTVFSLRQKANKKQSWLDKNVNIMCRNFSKKRTRFAVIDIESERSAEYDEIHAVSSEGTLREWSKSSKSRSSSLRLSSSNTLDAANKAGNTSDSDDI